MIPFTDTLFPIPDTKKAARLDPDLMALVGETSLSPEQRKALDIKKAERALIGQRIPGFFPTPENVALRMVALAGIKEGMTVLEPSAGPGSIADVITEKRSRPQVIEWNYALQQLLALKWYEVLGNDLLAHFGTYDRIIKTRPLKNSRTSTM